MSFLHNVILFGGYIEKPTNAQHCFLSQCGTSLFIAQKILFRIYIRLGSYTKSKVDVKGVCTMDKASKRTWVLLVFAPLCVFCFLYWFLLMYSPYNVRSMYSQEIWPPPPITQWNRWWNGHPEAMYSVCDWIRLLIEQSYNLPQIWHSMRAHNERGLLSLLKALNTRNNSVFWLFLPR